MKQVFISLVLTAIKSLPMNFKSTVRCWFQHIYQRWRSLFQQLSCCFVIEGDLCDQQTDGEVIPNDQEREKNEKKPRTYSNVACCDPLHEYDSDYWTETIAHVNVVKFRDHSILLGKKFQDEGVAWLFKLPMATGVNTISTLGNTRSTQCVFDIAATYLTLQVHGKRHTWFYGEEIFLSGSLSIDLQLAPREDEKKMN